MKQAEGSNHEIVRQDEVMERVEGTYSQIIKQLPCLQHISSCHKRS
jgi:hypothetical protein